MWIRRVSQDETTGLVKRYYDGVLKERGYVPETISVLLKFPHLPKKTDLNKLFRIFGLRNFGSPAQFFFAPTGNR